MHSACWYDDSCRWRNWLHNYHQFCLLISGNWIPMIYEPKQIILETLFYCLKHENRRCFCLLTILSHYKCMSNHIPKLPSTCIFQAKTRNARVRVREEAKIGSTSWCETVDSATICILYNLSLVISIFGGGYVYAS